MAGIYRPRHLERTVFYRVLSHHFDRFLAEYEGAFIGGGLASDYPNERKIK